VFFVETEASLRCTVARGGLIEKPGRGEAWIPAVQSSFIDN